MVKTILNHNLEIIEIQNFKDYLKEHENSFSGFSLKSFLKSIDIPASYFLEQPDSTKEILLDNKEDRICTLKKYIGKCLVVLWKDDVIMNVCRMNKDEAEMKIEQLSSIEEVDNVVWTKEFYKDGYLQGYIPVDKLSNSKYGKCLVIDFPILLNKPAQMHEAFVKLPNEDSWVEEDLVYYNASIDIDFNEYQHISLAIQEGFDTISNKTEVTSLDTKADNYLMKEPEEVLCLLVEEKIIPKNLIVPVARFINKNLEGVDLTVKKMTEILLSYEGNLRSIKQITNLRSCYDFLYNTFSSNK